MNVDYKENCENESFSSKTKTSKPCIPIKRTCFSAKSQKEHRLSWECKFIPFNGWTLILKKMVEIKAFLPKPKHQNCVSRWKEHVYFPNHKKNVDYHKNPCLSQLKDVLQF